MLSFTSCIGHDVLFQEQKRIWHDRWTLNFNSWFVAGIVPFCFGICWEFPLNLSIGYRPTGMHHCPLSKGPHATEQTWGSNTVYLIIYTVHPITWLPKTSRWVGTLILFCQNLDSLGNGSLWLLVVSGTLWNIWNYKRTWAWAIVAPLASQSSPRSIGPLAQHPGIPKELPRLILVVLISWSCDSATLTILWTKDSSRIQLTDSVSVEWSSTGTYVI